MGKRSGRMWWYRPVTPALRGVRKRIKSSTRPLEAKTNQPSKNSMGVGDAGGCKMSLMVRDRKPISGHCKGIILLRGGKQGAGRYV